MTRSGSILLICLLFGACKTVSTNNNVLSPAKLEPVILDMQLAEAYAAAIVPPGTNAQDAQKDSFLVYRKAVLSRHHIRDEDYTYSMKWYSANPEQLDTMYAHVNARLNQLKDTKPVN